MKHCWVYNGSEAAHHNSVPKQGFTLTKLIESCSMVNLNIVIYLRTSLVLFCQAILSKSSQMASYVHLTFFWAYMFAFLYALKLDALCRVAILNVNLVFAGGSISLMSRQLKCKFSKFTCCSFSTFLTFLAIFCDYELRKFRGQL